MSTQLQNPEITGITYQQGELFGFKVQEYLLHKWGRKCAYCGVENVPFEIEHIHPKSKGGSDRVSNLTIACHNCNQSKGNQPVEQFLAKKPELRRRILAQAKVPLEDAAAVNTTRWERCCI
jgi:5-methylcytosine-specific restriction endonuclease McrA